MANTFKHNGKDIPLAPNIAPNEEDEYGADWEDKLDVGETLLTSTWILPTGIVGGVGTMSTTQTSIKLSGATLGERYLVTNRVTTTEGNTLERSMYIRCCIK